MSTSIKKAGLPFIILIAAFVLMMILISLKDAPEKEEIVEKDFLVDVQSIEFGNVDFMVYSQGSVEPRNSTMLSAQVSGRVINIAPNFIEGGFFNKGDVLVELEPVDYQTDLLRAEAELARAQAALDEEQARGRVAAQEWRSVNQGVAPELGLRKPQLAREQANLKAAQANLERAKRNLARTKITAPYDGLVKARKVDLGQFVPMGSQIGEVFSTEVAEVRLPLTDNDIAFIDDLASNQPKVSLVADVAGKQIRWQGTMVRDEAVLDGRSRVIYGVVQVLDPYQRDSQSDNMPLRFGRFVSAEIQGASIGGLVTLPRHLLRLDGTILTVDGDNKLRINSVGVTKTDESYVYINSGLQADHQVVMSAVPNPYDGMPVRLSQAEPLSEQGDMPAEEL